MSTSGTSTGIGRTGTLVIFDTRPDCAPIYERIAITTVQSPAGRAITLLRA
jgi:hypothetical protein